MTRPLALALAFALVAGTPAAAAAQSFRGAVKYGKWIVAAGAIGMDLLAARASDRAADTYAALEERCIAEPFRCNLRPDGAYADAESEFLYQRSLVYDRRARRWLIGGQVALAAAAVGFIWELTRPAGPPSNKPFDPEPAVSATRDGARVGVRMAF